MFDYGESGLFECHLKLNVRDFGLIAIVEGLRFICSGSLACNMLSSVPTFLTIYLFIFVLT